MKKIILILVLTCVTLPAPADSHSESLLRKLSGKVKSMGDYNARFNVQADGGEEVSGFYAVSGDKYYMHTDDYEVICNGKVKYEVSHLNEEVIVDYTNPQDRNILSNPTRAFEFAGDSFSSTYAGERSEAQMIVDVIYLVPTDMKSSLQGVTLKINRATGLPVEISYRMDGIAEEVKVRITKFSAGVGGNASFVFEETRYKGYEIVDFR